MVCLPFPLSTSDTAPVASWSPGCSAFSNVDFPTPEGPVTMESLPASRSRSSSRPIDGLRARVHDVVADALVGLEERPRRVVADEVHLVGDHQGGDLVVLGNDQEAVDQPGVRRRAVAREDHGHQIGVGDQHVLPPRPARPGLAAAEAPRSRLDGDDGAGAVGEPLHASPGRR